MTHRIDSDRLPEPHRAAHAAARIARDDAMALIVAALANRYPGEARARAWREAGEIARTIEANGAPLDLAALGADIAPHAQAYHAAVIAEAGVIDSLLRELVPEREAEPCGS